MVFKKASKRKGLLTNCIAVLAFILALNLLLKINETSPIAASFVIVKTSSSFIVILILGVLFASFLRAERLHQTIRLFNINCSRYYSYTSFFYGMLLAFTPGRSAELLRFVSDKKPVIVNFKSTGKIFIVEKLADVAVIGFISLPLLPIKLSYILVIGGVCFTVLVLSSLRKYIFVMILSLIPWVIEGSLLFAFLSANIKNLEASLAHTISLFSFASLLGAITFVPGGILVSEIVFVEMYDELQPENIFVLLVVFRMFILVLNLFSGIIGRFLR